MPANTLFFSLLGITILLLPLGDFLSLVSGLRLSVLFRGLLTLIVLCLLFSYRRVIRFHPVLVLGSLVGSLIFLVSIFYAENHITSFDFIELLNFLIKIIMPLLFWLVLTRLADTPVKIKGLYKYLFFTLMLYVVAIPISAALGFDFFRTYGAESGRFGFKGIISAANETSGVLYAAMGGVCVLYLKNQMKHYVLAFIFILIAALLLGTKGGIIGVFILFFGLLYAKKGMLFSLSLGGLSLVVISSLLFVIYFNSEAVQATVALSTSYFQYQLDNGANGSIINLLLSGRLSKLDAVLIDVEKMSYLPIFFGGVNVLSTFVEMDFFDILFLFGLPLTFFIFYFWFNIFVLKTKTNKKVHKFMVVFFAGWFFLSFLAGHFIYSATASLYFVYLASLSAYQETKELT